MSSNSEPTTQIIRAPIVWRGKDRRHAAPDVPSCRRGEHSDHVSRWRKLLRILGDVSVASPPRRLRCLACSISLSLSLYLSLSISLSLCLLHPAQGSKSQNQEKRVSESKTPPFHPTPEKCVLNQRIPIGPILSKVPCIDMGIFDLKRPFLGWGDMGVFSTPKPSFFSDWGDFDLCAGQTDSQLCAPVHVLRRIRPGSRGCQTPLSTVLGAPKSCMVGQKMPW